MVITSACQANFVHLCTSLGNNLHSDLDQFPVFCLQSITGACLSPSPGQCYVGSSRKGAPEKHYSQTENVLILFVLSIELSPVFFPVKLENLLQSSISPEAVIKF